MSLFEVPGWSVPSAPVQESKKRKRPSRAADGEDKVRGVEVNLDRLVAKMDAISGEAGGRKKKKAKREGREGEGAAAARPNGAGEGKKGRKDNGKGKGEERKPHSTTSAATPSSKKSKKAVQATAKTDPSPTLAESNRSAKPKAKHGGASKDLTALQSGMKNSLEGARFRCVFLTSQYTYSSSQRPIHSRWINEELYKSDSARAHEMMREDPNVFHEVRPRSAYITPPKPHLHLQVPQGLQTSSRIVAVKPRGALYRRAIRLPTQNCDRGSWLWRRSSRSCFDT